MSLRPSRLTASMASALEQRPEAVEAMRETVPDGPVPTVLGEPAAGTGPDDLQDGELGWPAGGGVRTVRRDPLRHLVTLGQLFFHNGVEIWEDPMDTGQPVPQARQAWREPTARNVVDAGGGYELGGDGEIALVEDLLD